MAEPPSSLMMSGPQSYVNVDGPSAPGNNNYTPGLSMIAEGQAQGPDGVNPNALATASVNPNAMMNPNVNPFRNFGAGGQPAMNVVGLGQQQGIERTET